MSVWDRRGVGGTRRWVGEHYVVVVDPTSIHFSEFLANCNFRLLIPAKNNYTLLLMNIGKIAKKSVT